VPSPTYPSTQKLVRALEAEHNPKLEAIIRRAKRNEFNDYFSESAMPIVDLVRALEKAGFRALATRARNGEFDGTREESEAYAKSDEGRLAFAELTGGLFVPPETEG
jgi:hypothetical protein